MKKILTYLLTVFACVIVLLLSYGYVTKGLAVFTDNTSTITASAKVQSILDEKTTTYQLGPDNTIQSSLITFQCTISDGEYKGMEVSGTQTVDGFSGGIQPVVPGDRIVVYLLDGGDVQTGWIFGGYERLTALSLLLLLFFGLLLVFGRKKGINTILSLILTCCMVFVVFIPSILTGHNIYLWSIFTCIYTIAMTLLLVNGWNMKSLAAGLGCCGGVLVAGLLTVGMDRVLRLSGMVDENAMYLTTINTAHPIDLNAIIFAGIIIGAMGAVMDVGMSVASALHEVKVQAPGITWKQLIRSGLTIGQDMMGTMANTLVLAYIGSSLSVVLLLVSYSASLSELLNREMIIVEILQALVGSLGILITIPLTSLICGILYRDKSLLSLQRAPKPLPYSFAGEVTPKDWNLSQPEEQEKTETTVEEVEKESK